MRLIDADKLPKYTGYALSASDVAIAVENAPTVDAVPVVRCKDCKHRPTKPEKYRDGFDLEFPDGACPCKCEDPFYSWYPFDDWFCPRGKRKGGDE